MCALHSSVYASAPVFSPYLCSLYMFTAHRAILLKTEKDNVAAKTADKVSGETTKYTLIHSLTHIHARA